MKSMQKGKLAKLNIYLKNHLIVLKNFTNSLTLFMQGRVHIWPYTPPPLEFLVSHFFVKTLEFCIETVYQLIIHRNNPSSRNKEWNKLLSS